MDMWKTGTLIVLIILAAGCREVGGPSSEAVDESADVASATSQYDLNGVWRVYMNGRSRGVARIRHSDAEIKGEWVEDKWGVCADGATWFEGEVMGEMLVGRLYLCRGLPRRRELNGTVFSKGEILSIDTNLPTGYSNRVGKATTARLSRISRQ